MFAKSLQMLPSSVASSGRLPDSPRSPNPSTLSRSSSETSTSPSWIDSTSDSASSELNSPRSRLINELAALPTIPVLPMTAEDIASDCTAARELVRCDHCQRCGPRGQRQTVQQLQGTYMSPPSESRVLVREAERTARGQRTRRGTPSPALGPSPSSSPTPHLAWPHPSDPAGLTDQAGRHSRANP